MPGANYLNSVTNNWRVCAGINESSIKKCKIFFSKIINIKKFPITYFNDPTYSETAKILENSYRATNISLIDEWSKFAEINNLNLWSIIDTIKVRPTHNNIMSPGFGVGGHCLTKDPKFIEISSKYILKESSSGFPQTSSALKINNSMPLNVFNKIRKYFLNKLNGKKVLILGVSYKAGVEDTRKTPTGILYDKLKKNGAQINLHDPLVRYWPEKKRIVDKTIPNFDNYNVVVLATDHKEYKKINIKYLNKFKKKILIIDTINFFKDKLSQDLKNNFVLLSIGK
jgi:nucleotide sugar dehydrogenase